MAALYLIPVTLGDTPIEKVLPAYNREIILACKHFIVEEIRTARRFLKAVERSIDIDSLVFCEMGKHADAARFSQYLDPLRRGENVGVISEAGCPAVADPGADIVAIAQREGLEVVPLVGPSSILLSVMASGFNGQSFAFHGYLPIDAAQRAKGILPGAVAGIIHRQRTADAALHRNALPQCKTLCRHLQHLCAADETLRGSRHHDGERMD